VVKNILRRMYKMYKVQTKDVFGEVQGHPYFSLVETLINECIEENKLEIEELYYPSFTTIDRVYSESVYKPAIETFLEKQYNSETQYYKAKDGGKYRFNWEISK
jgi:hypothetical protein